MYVLFFLLNFCHYNWIEYSKENYISCLFVFICRIRTIMFFPWNVCHKTYCMDCHSYHDWHIVVSILTVFLIVEVLSLFLLLFFSTSTHETPNFGQSILSTFLPPPVLLSVSSFYSFGSFRFSLSPIATNTRLVILWVSTHDVTYSYSTLPVFFAVRATTAIFYCWMWNHKIHRYRPLSSSSSSSSSPSWSPPPLPSQINITTTIAETIEQRLTSSHRHTECWR